MSETVKIVECPRDAWQGLPVHIPASLKAQHLSALIGAGFRHIDAVSFVSPKAVPQMSDSEEVLRAIEIPPDVEIIAIVVNEKGAERAMATGSVRTLGFPYSVSPTFLERNQKQSLEEAIEELERIRGMAAEADLNVVVYISMAFGNPYGDRWSIEEVLEAVGILTDEGIQQISLADTAGVAGAEAISPLLEAVYRRYDYLEVGVHLHSRPEGVAAKVLAAYDAGCRRFDSALGGFGGCPFALSKDELIGNLPTEAVLRALGKRDVQLPIRKPPDSLLRSASDIGLKYSAKKVS